MTDARIIEQAKQLAKTKGISLREAIKKLRLEKRERLEQAALAEAPSAMKGEDGTYLRVCADPRWPFGVEEGRAVAPHGLSPNRLPKTTLVETKNVPASAKKEARDIIEGKLKRMGCDPIAIMAELAMSTLVKDEVRLRAAAELSSMLYPRLKGVENVTKTDNHVFVIAVPSERPETGPDWLAGAEGPRRLIPPSEEDIVVQPAEVTTANE